MLLLAWAMAACVSACSLDRAPLDMEGLQAGSHDLLDAGLIVRIAAASSPTLHAPNDPPPLGTDPDTPTGQAGTSATATGSSDAATGHARSSDPDAGAASAPGDSRCDNDADCNRAMPFCDTSTHACVECIAHDDCQRATAAQCQAGHCQPCSANDACAHIPGRSSCGRADSAGVCVACVENSDCHDLALPECDGRACVPCTSQAACSGRPGAGVCDLATSAVQQSSDGEDDGRGKGKKRNDKQQKPSRGTGACVECTASDASACGEGSCDAEHTRCKTD
jgi:hypothetical protein